MQHWPLTPPPAKAAMIELKAVAAFVYGQPACHLSSLIPALACLSHP